MQILYKCVITLSPIIVEGVVGRCITSMNNLLGIAIADHQTLRDC